MLENRYKVPLMSDDIICRLLCDSKLFIVTSMKSTTLSMENWRLNKSSKNVPLGTTHGSSVQERGKKAPRGG